MALRQVDYVREAMAVGALGDGLRDAIDPY
jgi:hypothetical protein